MRKRGSDKGEQGDACGGTVEEFASAKRVRMVFPQLFLSPDLRREGWLPSSCRDNAPDWISLRAGAREVGTVNERPPGYGPFWQ